MAKRYIFVRMPVETFEGFKMKKNKMESDIKDLTGKKVNLTMPKVFSLVSKHPVEIDKKLLVKFAKLKRGFY
jgi:hypothetical protein